MKIKAFCPMIEYLHKAWVAEKLYLSKGHDWVDLWTNAFSGVKEPMYFELKARLRRKTNEIFCVREPQVQEYRREFGDRYVFWVFLIYTMSMKVKKIKYISEDFIVSREIYVLPWKWINRFEVYSSSSGEHRYPKERFMRQYKLEYHNIDGTSFYVCKDNRLRALFKSAQEIPF